METVFHRIMATCMVIVMITMTLFLLVAFTIMGILAVAAGVHALFP